VSLELHADYDRDGRLTGSPVEYGARATTPGAVLVANLDTDQRRLPARVAAGRPVAPDQASLFKTAADDELLPLRIQVRTPIPAGTQVVLRLPVSGLHHVRLRVYDDTGTLLRTAANRTDRPLALTPGGARTLDLRVEARTVPGSPDGRAVLLDTRVRLDQPEESRFALQVVGRDAAQRETVFDTAHFSLAPILFLDNIARATRIYISERPVTLPSVEDLRTALAAIGGIELVTVPDDVSAVDTWLQDQFQPGIIVGADGWRHLIVHLPRRKSNASETHAASNLAQFVRSHFPARNVGVLNDLWNRQLSLADVHDRMHTIGFADLLTLADRMNGVYRLKARFDRVLSRLDPTHVALSLDWATARSVLRDLLVDLERAIRRARQGATVRRQETLDATRTDMRDRVQRMEQMFPEGPTSATLVLPTGGTGSIEVSRERAAELYMRIEQLGGSGTYGGNIEVAPPTAAAPLGTLVVGNALINGERDFMDPDLLRLLFLQRKQPVFQVDTTWLQVGHVDEVLTFAPAAGAGGAAALRASSALALQILRAAHARYLAGLPAGHRHLTFSVPSGIHERLTHEGTAPVTRLHRGKLWIHVHEPPPNTRELPRILEPPNIYLRLSEELNGEVADLHDPGRINYHDIHYWPGQGPLRAYPADITVRELLFCEGDDRRRSVNEFIEARFLQPMQRQVEAQFRGLPVLPLPVLFDRVPDVAIWEQNQWSFETSAFTPDVVNMQVLNGHLVVPRPYGPRMRPADAVAVLQEVFRETRGAEHLARQVNLRFFQRHRLTTTICWIHRQDAIAPVIDVAPYSGIETRRPIFAGLTTLQQIAQAFKDGFPGLEDAEIERRILADNRSHFTGAGELRDGWRRFVIREDMVDLFEASVHLVADAIGTPVHFVDSWFYHLHGGEIHCGTNVLRVPGRGPLLRWWTAPDAPLGA
jgi:hypothetical protein